MLCSIRFLAAVTNTTAPYADLPVIQTLICKVTSLREAPLRPAASYVLIYEALFGQVCICCNPHWLPVHGDSWAHHPVHAHHIFLLDSVHLQIACIHCLQGCRVKGKAEKAVYAVKVQLCLSLGDCSCTCTVRSLVPAGGLAPAGSQQSA